MSNQLQLFTDSDIHVQWISHSIAKPFIYEHHYLRGIGNNFSCFGAYQGNVLVGVVAFSIPCSERVRASVFGEEYKQNVVELGRLCLLPTTTVPASKIVSKTIKEMVQYRIKKNLPQIHGIISFADSGAGHHGGVYQSMSWLFCGEDYRKMTVYIDETGRVRHPRQNTVNITLAEAKRKGWTHRTSTTSKYRYIKILGTSTQKKYFKSLLQYQVLPYPKPSINNGQQQ